MSRDNDCQCFVLFCLFVFFCVCVRVFFCALVALSIRCDPTSMQFTIAILLREAIKDVAAWNSVCSKLKDLTIGELREFDFVGGFRAFPFTRVAVR